MSTVSPSLAGHLRPYDAAGEYNLTMYDHLPYDRDLSLCNSDAIMMESGNIIKYYRCAMKEPYTIDHTNKEMGLAKSHAEGVRQKRRIPSAAIPQTIEDSASFDEP